MQICTGGTEVGHSNGEYSHENGYKLDFRPSDELIAFSGLNKMSKTKVRKDLGGGISATFYRHPPDHFDVLFKAA